MFLPNRGLAAGWVAFSCAASLMLLSAGCEPTSITEARNQLKRGPARIVQLTIPIAQDTITVGQFLGSDTTTTPDGLVAIAFAPETLAVAVGEKLKFDNLSFDAFTFGYDQMLRTGKPETLSVDLGGISPAPGVAGSPGVSGDTVRFGTAQGASVDSAVVATGQVVLELNNGTNCSGTFTVNVVDSAGTVLGSISRFVSASSSSRDSASLANKTMRRYVRLQASASGAGSCVPTGTASVRAIFSPLTLSAVRLRNINESFSQTYTPLAGEPRITAVDSVTVRSGSFTLQVQNKLPIQFSGTVRLDGVLVGGNPLQQNVTVPASSSTNVVFNLAGALILPAAVVARVSGTATAAVATLTPAVTTDAIVVTGGGSLQVERLSGKLDPAKTPELTIAVSDSQEISSGDFDFGDLKDAIQQARLNDARIRLRFRNTSGAPFTLSGFKLGVVKLTATGGVPRDGSGNIVYQTDSLGPITVAVADSGKTTLTIARRDTSKTVTLQAARLLDRVVDSVLGNKRMGIVASGSVVVGDTLPSVISRTDSVSLRLALSVALDFSVPASGVTFKRARVADGADLEPKDADQIAQRVDTASATAIVTNGTPFGVQVRIAMVRDSQPPSVDADSIFRMANRVEIGPVSLAPAAVDAQGRVTTPVLDTATVSITGNNARVLLGKKFTAAIRITLVPNASNPRGAIRPTDRVLLRASGSVRLKSGGTP